ncbi:MAG TPA: CAP domain-containing protein [Motilibacterales bacterium]|nr:CAP domain-containing protein [Motilibacterales bacterium]
MNPVRGLHHALRSTDDTDMGYATTPGLRKVAAALAIGCVSISGVPAASAAPFLPTASAVSASPRTAGQSAEEVEVLRLTNQARSHSRKCGGTKMKAVRPLAWSDTLAASAEAHSADMANANYFSHYTQSGQSPFQRIRAAGYSYRAAGENIAAGRSLASPDAVVMAWLRSPGHCKVIMNGKYKELGVGGVEGPGEYGIYWTQNFGVRKSG